MATFEWNEGQRLETKFGPVVLFKALLTKGKDGNSGWFWKHWKTHKQILKDNNISCSPDTIEGEKMFKYVKCWYPDPGDDMPLNEVRDEMVNKFETMIGQILMEEEESSSE